MSLVDVVDDVLDQLEADRRLRFTLDGQLATVDDYLEIRPEGEERIRSLVREGRLAINGRIEARVVNQHAHSQTAVVDGSEVRLRPWEIRTVLLG